MSETATLDEISKAELADVIESVASAVEEEFDYDTDIFNYYCITEDKVYLYSINASINANPMPERSSSGRVV